MTTKPETEQKLTQEQFDQKLATLYREHQEQRARVAKFMGCSIDKVVRGRDGGWTTR